jgi:putative DeoR family transcriptional regulator (stage III sporulation protein D)
MLDYIVRRVREEAEYIVDTGATVRATAKQFNISKSSVHKDMTERLKCVDKLLYVGVKSVLNNNLCQRHIRGGLATKRKYMLKKEQKIINLN